MTFGESLMASARMSWKDFLAIIVLNGFPDSPSPCLLFRFFHDKPEDDKKLCDK
jgi:hypothetical protein